MASFNLELLQGCHKDERRRMEGKDQSIGAALLIERDHLLPLVPEGIDLVRISFPKVNSLGCVKVLTNSYSVPLKAGTLVKVKSYASKVELWHDGQCVARHERSYRWQQQVLDLEHYLHVLSRKPGALGGSRPLEQQRRAGLWPECFGEIWQAFITRHGKQTGTRQMVDLLKLTKEFGRDRLRQAVEIALETGCMDAAAVQHLMQARDLDRPPCDAVDIGLLLGTSCSEARRRK